MYIDFLSEKFLNNKKCTKTNNSIGYYILKKNILVNNNQSGILASSCNINDIILPIENKCKVNQTNFYLSSNIKYNFPIQVISDGITSINKLTNFTKYNYPTNMHDTRQSNFYFLNKDKYREFNSSNIYDISIITYFNNYYRYNTDKLYKVYTNDNYNKIDEILSTTYKSNPTNDDINIINKYYTWIQNLLLLRNTNRESLFLEKLIKMYTERSSDDTFLANLHLITISEPSSYVIKVPSPVNKLFISNNVTYPNLLNNTMSLTLGTTTLDPITKDQVLNIKEIYNNSILILPSLTKNSKIKIDNSYIYRNNNNQISVDNNNWININNSININNKIFKLAGIGSPAVFIVNFLSISPSISSSIISLNSATIGCGKSKVRIISDSLSILPRQPIEITLNIYLDPTTSYSNVDKEFTRINWYIDGIYSGNKSSLIFNKNTIGIYNIRVTVDHYINNCNTLTDNINITVVDNEDEYQDELDDEYSIEEEYKSEDQLQNNIPYKSIKEKFPAYKSNINPFIYNSGYNFDINNIKQKIICLYDNLQDTSDINYNMIIEDNTNILFYYDSPDLMNVYSFELNPNITITFSNLILSFDNLPDNVTEGSLWSLYYVNNITIASTNVDPIIFSYTDNIKYPIILPLAIPITNNWKNNTVNGVLNYYNNLFKNPALNNINFIDIDNKVILDTPGYDIVEENLTTFLNYIGESNLITVTDICVIYDTNSNLFQSWIITNLPDPTTKINIITPLIFFTTIYDPMICPADMLYYDKKCMPACPNNYKYDLGLVCLKDDPKIYLPNSTQCNDLIKQTPNINAVPDIIKGIIKGCNTKYFEKDELNPITQEQVEDINLLSDKN